MSLWATKSITDLRAEADATGERSLQAHPRAGAAWWRSASAPSSAPASSSSPGRRPRLHAGPAVPISMVIVGIACAFAGLCYAEMASAVPIAGSAYTYAYATMGELVAWIIGWDLVLEYAVGASTVAVGWSGYLVSLLSLFGIALPAAPDQRADAVVHRRQRAGGRWRGARTPAST